MSKIMCASLAVVVTVLLSTTTLQAQSSNAPQAVAQEVSEREKIATLQQKSQEAFAAGNWVAFYSANMKLNRLRPYEPEYFVNIVRACALIDRKSTAYHFMLQMQQQGMSYDFNSTDDTLNIRNTEAYEYINGMLVDAAKTAGVGVPAFTLPGSPADFRAIAWDGSRDRFLVGTLNSGTIIAVSADGETEVLVEANDENGLWSIGGLAVDAKSNRLWVSSTATSLFTGFSSEDENKGALFEFDLKTLELVNQYYLPYDGLKHELGSVAVSDDGHVYVINRAAPIIYGKTPDGDLLEPVFGDPKLSRMQDITVTPDNSRVFVSDAHKGILTIDPVAEQAAMLGGPETMNLGGIEGIEYRDGYLYVVQGGFNPQRLIRLELDTSGSVVQSVSPMAIALDDFNRPANSTIKGDSLYYFANSGAEDSTGTIVMSTPLDAGAEVMPPDMALFEQKLREQQQKKD
jgi:hypothetical protein